MADTAQEKTERATPRKLEKAREQGQVASSQDLNSVVIITFGFLTIYFMGPILFNNLGRLMKNTLSDAPGMMVNPDTIAQVFTDKIFAFAAVVGPIFLSLAFFAYLINVAQVGILFSAKSIEPKPDKLDIAKGLKRLISKKSLANLIRDILKTIIIAIIAYYTISGWLPEILSMGDKTVGQYGATLGRLGIILSIKIMLALLIIALFDFAFQRYDHATQLKMTKQEVREELKDTEGNPIIKGRVRQIQREMARRRMMSEIPKADVVITNPTQVAVALKYDPQTMEAPTVVGKGQRLIAEQIKKIAREYDIPIVENKPLARSLFKMVDVGEMVPHTLYRAVAEVLAYIYRLKDRKGVSLG